MCEKKEKRLEKIPESLYQQFQTLIYSESGICFTEVNRPILEGRMLEWQSLHHPMTLEESLQEIRRNPQKLRELLDVVTTNLTRFFRNSSHYEGTINFILPDLIEKKQAVRDYSFSLWSAGCSTGEEAYTNAMILKERLPQKFKILVLASDLSLRSLSIARSGLYDREKLKNIPECYTKYFSEEKNQQYRVVDSVKNLVKFEYHNLKYKPTVTNIDLIFCRNVLIYFDVEIKKKLASNFWQAMAPYAYLIIGHSETLLDIKTDFEFVRNDCLCCYRKNIQQ